MKFCKDCKYCEIRDDAIWTDERYYCNNEKVKDSHIDIVTGDRFSQRCYYMRNGGTCGYDAIYFEAKIDAE